MRVKPSRPWRVLLVLILALAGSRAFGETGYWAWLRYEPLGPEKGRDYASLPTELVTAGDSPVLRAARDEVTQGVLKMLGFKLRLASAVTNRPAIIIGTLSQLSPRFPELRGTLSVGADGFWLRALSPNSGGHVVITGQTERGVLYGSFALLRRIALNQSVTNLDIQESPFAPIRFLNHWDNLDGSIERGYAGRSIFWEQGHIVDDLHRASDYARLMASLGINGCSLNNVNADARVITPEFLAQVARVADAFRPWGVRVLLSIDFASPKKIGGLPNFDPVDPQVISFWQSKVDEVYRFIPDLAGFILKADSEGRLGPSAYGRTHADAANVIARPLRNHGGLLFYRGFVYDHHMDWRNLKLDRAKAAYDNFQPLDGQFDDNVVLQIKHGPIDFQVREPVSPLFGALRRSSQAIELQITQEYTGQQRHLCFLAPMWKEVLDFDLQVRGPGTPVKEIVAGRTFQRPTGGFVAVANVGRDTNWLGHDLALANLYAFGRLAWNPELTPKQIAQEWSRQTFGHDPLVDETVVDLELKSWPAYENYTGPLAAGTLTDIIGVHYGPAVESSEHNGWGQWHRADDRGVGMDRTVATGTGFIGQYSPAVAAQFESLTNCPDGVLLFMQHVRYTHVLHSGKTVIQHIYDSHYAGAEQAARFVQEWSALKGRVDDERFEKVLKRLKYQAGHAVVWRDAVNNWFLKTSGISDVQGRSGHFPNRIEAEDMVLDGYSVFTVTPWEAASGGNAVQISAPGGRGALSYRYPGTPGVFDLNVQYFDQNNGQSLFRLLVAGREVDHWIADDSLPSSRPDGHTSTRRTIDAVALARGTEIRIEATAHEGEKACVDYMEIVPKR